MKLTNAEKLIISMLASLHTKLDIEPDTAKLIAEAIHTDNTWALSWALPGIVGDGGEPSPREVGEVTDYLDMWSFIEEGIEALAPELQAELDAEIPGSKSFPGFDGNNEADHFSIARFLVGPLDRFDRFADRDLNSHHPTLHRYAAMYAIFEPMRASLGLRRPLSMAALKQILSA